jgi:hypothetical protein
MKKVLIMFLISLLCLVSLSVSVFAQGGSGGEKTDKATGSEALKISLEVLNITRVDLASGKYSAELGINVQFPSLDLPDDIDFNVYESEILPKIKKEDGRELGKFYLYDEENFCYSLKEDLSEKDAMKAYKILKSSGYYENNLPFELVNGRIEKNEKTDKPKVDRIEDPNDPTFVYYKINAEMSAKFDFKYFPFDKQSLPIKLACPYVMSAQVFKPMDEITLLPDAIEAGLFDAQVAKKLTGENRTLVLGAYKINNEKTSYELKEDVSKADEKKITAAFDSIGFNSLISPSVKLPGWTIRQGVPKYGVDSYMKERFSTFTFPITMTRDRLSAFLKVFMPLLILMVASFVSLFIGTSVAGNRYAVTAGMLLACAMLHLNATSSLPQIGYMTMTDKVFIFSYLSILLNLASSVLLISFNEKKQEKNVKMVYTTALWLVPSVTLICYLLIFSHVI